MKNIENSNELALFGENELLPIAIDHYENDRMESAIAAFLMLANQDCEEAFLYLSLIYKEGDGTPADELKAARYKKMYVQKIEALAKAGLPDFQLRLAYILQFGDGVVIDSKRAFSIFLKLANEGCGEAQFHLSRIYAHGECGQRRDGALESHWLAEATKSEWPIAIYYSALFLGESANLAEINLQKEMMKRSAELGCWQAKEYLLANS